MPCVIGQNRTQNKSHSSLVRKYFGVWGSAPVGFFKNPTPGDAPRAAQRLSAQERIVRIADPHKIQALRRTDRATGGAIPCL